METYMITPYKNTDGTTETLGSKYPAQVLLIVNTASKCGYTKQYAGLEELYRTYKDKGLTVIAFPSNDFGGQEPGTDEEIMLFCKSKYDVTFPVKSKMSTKGNSISPLYTELTSKKNGHEGEIGWNFEKFLVGRDGTIIGRYKSGVGPSDEKMIAEIEKALAAK